jgi:hypothetical protein
MEVIGNLYTLSAVYEKLGENGRATRAHEFLVPKAKI